MPTRPGRRRAALVTLTCAAFAAPAFVTASLAGAAPAGAAPAAACPTTGLTAIPAVQGAGAASPMSGRTVTVQGVVVGDLQQGGFDGFAVQDPRGDGSAATSDGVFVHAPGAADVRLGDVVQVTGTVTEFKGLTEITRPTAVRACGRAALPAPAPLDLPADPARLEALEGMRVATVDRLTVTEVHGLDRHGELTLSANGRQWSPTEIAEPGTAARRVAAANARNRIVLDDGRTTTYTSARTTPPFLAAGRPVRVGDTVARLDPTVLLEAFGAHRLEPADGTAAGTTFRPSNPRPATPAAIGGDVRIADANVLNYFVTFGKTSRGAKDAAGLARQEAKTVAMLRGLNADVIGLQEIENSCVTTPKTPYQAVERLTRALNGKEKRPVWAFSKACEKSDVITNAIVYRTDRVTPAGAPVIATEDAVWDNAREPLAQTFTAKGHTFTVVVNHFKSKGSGAGAGNTDSGDGQGKSNADRVAQARSLVTFAAGVQARAKSPDVLLVGDFNAYTKEDPLDVLRAAGYVDVGATRAKGDPSYVFDGGSGSLDHVFATPSAARRITCMDVWNVNAEESAAYQYDAPFPTLYAQTPYRSSDHNPAVVGLTLRR